MDNNLISIIVFVLGVSLLIGVLYYKGKKEEAKKIILALVIKAEQVIEGKGQGGLKYAWVSERVFNLLPPVVKFFLTEADVDQLIEDSVEELKILLQQKES